MLEMCLPIYIYILNSKEIGTLNNKHLKSMYRRNIPYDDRLFGRQLIKIVFFRLAAQTKNDRIPKDKFLYFHSLHPKFNLDWKKAFAMNVKFEVHSISTWTY